MIKRYKEYIHEEEKSDESSQEELLKENEPKLNQIKQIKPKTIEFKFCNLCNQKLYSNQDYNLHMNSKKHNKNFKKQIYLELKEAKTIKNYLINKQFIKKIRRSGHNKILYILYKQSLKKLIKNLPVK